MSAKAPAHHPENGVGRSKTKSGAVQDPPRHSPTAEPGAGSGSGRAEADFTHQTRAVFLWGAGLWFAFLLGYVLLPNLRGTASGLSDTIDALSVVDAILAQALALFGMMLVAHLELAILRARRGFLVRAVSVPTTAIVITLIMNAAVDALNPLALFALGTASALLTIAVGAAALLRGDPKTSRSGFLLGAGTVAALCAGARLAVWLGRNELALTSTTVSRVLSTGGFFLSFLLAAMVLFVLSRSSRRGRVAVSLLLCAALLATFVGVRGAGPDAPYLQVLVTRAASAIARPPLPFVSDGMLIFAELCGVGAALWAFLSPALGLSTRVVLGLGLFALRAPDVPLLSLTLALTALIAEVIALDSSEGAPPPSLSESGSD